ncbi:hypothetical protein ACN47A_37225 [Myxococcus fulvus]|uniref:hypothetical protein n=1 Tax=Myxococcus fulvus TaxID=33 RepID=UPI003B9DBC4D
MKTLTRNLLLLLGLTSASASAFNSDEHKRLGDEGSALLPLCTQPQQRNCRPTRVTTLSARSGTGQAFISFDLVKTYDPDNPDHIRLVDQQSQSLFKQELLERQQCYVDKQSSGQLPYIRALYAPPEAPPYSPTLVWVGDSSLPSGRGEYFSFGDLMAIYGDYRRAVTCDEQKRTCGLADEVTHMNPSLLGHLRNLGRGEVPPFGAFGNALQDSGGTPTDAPWWGDEMLRLAYTNDWHFQEQALRWYVGMHRQALYFARLAVETREDAHLWKALHYEANGLHSLTDLFAPGHLITSREQTVAGIYASNRVTPENNETLRWLRGVNTQGQTTASVPTALPAPQTSRLASYNALWARRLLGEENYHSGFNHHGSQFKNVAGNEWTGFGDGKLFPRRIDSGPVVELQQWTLARQTVTDSLQSLFNAYQELSQEAGSLTGEARKQKCAQVMERIARGRDFYQALRHVPVEAKNICFAPDKCCATRTWMGARYGAQVRALLQVPQSSTPLLPVPTGADLFSICAERTVQTETARLGVPPEPHQDDSPLRPCPHSAVSGPILSAPEQLPDGTVN